MWMMTTKKGREMRGQLLDYAADLYGRVREEIIASGLGETITKQKYVAMVTDAVNKYAIENGLAENIKKMLVKLLTTQWQHLKEEVRKK